MCQYTAWRTPFTNLNQSVPSSVLTYICVCVCVCVCLSVSVMCSAMSNFLRPPWTVAPSISSVYGIFQAKYWSGLPMGFLLQGISPTQGLNTGLLYCRQIRYLPSHQGSPIHTHTHIYIHTYTYTYKYIYICLWIIHNTYTYT